MMTEREEHEQQQKVAVIYSQITVNLESDNSGSYFSPVT